jgi:SAM-dependent methyltransferase
VAEPTYLVETRAAYDTVAADYPALWRGDLAENVFDRGCLAMFAEIVRAEGGGPVVDLGCGPGRITGPLSDLGLDVWGIDLSPAMVEVARTEYPSLRFEVGTMTDLPISTDELAGAVAWYSLIHLPGDVLGSAVREVARVVGPGGHVLTAFQVGDECLQVTEACGHPIGVSAYRRPPETVAQAFEEAGLEVVMRMVRRPRRSEKTPQAYLLARKVAS